MDSLNDVFSLNIHKFNLHHVRTKGPKPRGFHKIECSMDDRYVFVIGGLNNVRTFTNELWRFDLVSSTWSKLRARNMPKKLNSCCTAVFGKVLLVHGGDSLHFCELPVKDDVEVTFKKIEPTNPECSPYRWEHRMVLNGKCLFLVGGTPEEYSMDVDAFNFETREWIKLYNSRIDEHDVCPAPKQNHRVICYDDRLYIFGGGEQQSFSLMLLPAFDLRTNSWEFIQTIGDDASGELQIIPDPRQAHGCVQDPLQPNIVYIHGGAHDNDGDVMGDSWRIDLDTRKWTYIRSLDLGVGYHSVATTPNGRMIVFGGFNEDGAYSADLHSAWITIPKLADACFEAILYYLRKGNFRLPVSLASLGLPKKFKDRLASNDFQYSFV